MPSTISTALLWRALGCLGSFESLEKIRGNEGASIMVDRKSVSPKGGNSAMGSGDTHCTILLLLVYK